MDDLTHVDRVEPPPGWRRDYVGKRKGLRLAVQWRGMEDVATVHRCFRIEGRGPKGPKGCRVWRATILLFQGWTGTIIFDADTPQEAQRWAEARIMEYVLANGV